MTKETCHFFTVGPLYNVHDAIIQTCNRDLGIDENGNKQFYPPDVYEAALYTVANSKIIFSPNGIHPDPYVYEVDPEKAVRDVGARFAGEILQPYVDRTGHPVVKGKLGLLPDPEIEQLHANGELSLSPSVWSTYDGQNDVSKIRFQNLLIFPEIPGSQVVPGDPGTIFLNTKPNPEATPLTNDVNQTQNNTGNTMTDTIEKPVIDPALAAKIEEIAQQFSSFKNENDDLKAKFTAELATKDEEIKAAKEAIAQFTANMENERKAVAEREFQGMIHDTNFPPGLLAGDNAEESLRSEFFGSPAQFTRRVLAVSATQNKFLQKQSGDKQEQGQQFSAVISDMPTAKVNMLKKLGLNDQQIAEMK